MRKNILLLLIAVLLSGATALRAAVAPYDGAANLAAAQADTLNWMKYLPDDMFVAHVSIPGTHDAATAEGWKSSTGPTYSTTQAVNLDNQLEKGIRAFDFRPGLDGSTLYCNHGVDQTTLKLEDAMSKLTNYLDAHPSEFFVIHFFRGNVYNNKGDAGAALLKGGKDDDESRATYNRLMGELYNVKLADYIIDYDPSLKVKDIRGKIVLFRRDRINFVYLEKGANLWDWPADNVDWDPNVFATATHASKSIIKGVVQANDISSPENEKELNIEKNSVTNLFNYARTQTRPNDAKRSQGIYKPFWTMIFTSGAYKSENTKGYLDNAVIMNPLFTSLINDANAAGNYGPIGVVFSDWVLIDSHKYSSNTYNVQGVNIVPAIIENNFHYAADFILDDELFVDGEEEKIDYFEGKEYFMRNVATGKLLTAGATWNTMTALGDQPIRVIPEYHEAENIFKLKTTFANGEGAIGLADSDYYVDRKDDWTTNRGFTAKYAGSGFNFYFTHMENGQTRAMTAEVSANNYADGTEYYVRSLEFKEGDPMQQWEMITVQDYLNEQLAKADAENPVDLSFLIRGHDFWPNDGDNWTGTTNWRETGLGNNKTIHASYIVVEGTDEWNDKRTLLHCHNTKSSNFYNSNTVWSFSHTDSNLPAGIYKLTFKTAQYNFNFKEDLALEKFNVKTTGEATDQTIDIRDYLKVMPAMSSNDAAEAIKAFAEKPDTYTVSLDLTFDNPGSITFEASKTKTNSITGFFLDDIRLMYYGVTEEQANAALERVKAVAEYAKMEATALGLEEVYDNSEVERRIEEKAIANDGYSEIEMTMEALRKAVLTQNQEGADLTFAIYNPSFEFAPDYSRTDYTIGGSYPLGWDYPANYVSDSGVWPASDANKATSNPDGSYIFNTWEWGSAYEGGGRKISQKITLTPGLYQLKALVSSHQNNTVYIYAGNEQAGHTMSGDKSAFEEVTLEFFVSAEGPVEIGALGGNTDGSFNADGTGVWYKADNFRLTRLRNAEVIEYTPMGKYDTLILPFDVDMADDNYTDLAIYEIRQSTEHEHYVQLELVSPDPYELKANVPYVVEYLAYVEPEESEQPAQAPAMRAAAESGTFTFAGVPTHTSTTYTDASGLLIGSHSEQAPATGEFVMNHNANVGSAFTRVEEKDSPVVASHRAYISLPSASEKVTHVLLDEAQENTFITTGISAVEISADTEVDVYSVSGILLRRNVRASEALDGLAAGLYILRSETSTAKAIRTL